MSHTKQQRVDEAVQVETAEGDIGPWRRWAPMICVGIVAVGTTLGSPWVVWGAAVTALTGAALPHHPVDYFYNHIVRRFTGTGPLPPNTPERKVACRYRVLLPRINGRLLARDRDQARPATPGSLEPDRDPSTTWVSPAKPAVAGRCLAQEWLIS
jgi:hypothetical protein